MKELMDIFKGMAAFLILAVIFVVVFGTCFWINEGLGDVVGLGMCVGVCLLLAHGWQKK